MKHRVKVGLAAAAMLALPSAAMAQHPTHCEEEGAQPILSVGDFDGNGVVSTADVEIISAFNESGDYTPFFDLNADGVVNGSDVSATATNKGAQSTPLDQQMADLYWATEVYRDRGNAIAAGYRPFTQTLQGHGMHYTKLPFVPSADGGLNPYYENILDLDLSVPEPEGLNYDENGNLVAVFYYHGIDVKDWVLANEALKAGAPGAQEQVDALVSQSIYSSSVSAASGGMYPPLYASHDAVWHQHWGGCWDGLDYIQMFLDPTIVPNFNQHMFPQECAARATPDSRQGWVPAFNMLHVWLYDLNPCGVFAGTHPDVSVGFPEEPVARPLEHFFHVMGISNPYPDGGGGHH